MLELRRRYSDSAGGGQPSRLPAGYKEVEYLKSTGTQYIDTKVVTSPTVGIEIDAFYIYDNTFGAGASYISDTPKRFFPPFSYQGKAAYGYNDFIVTNYEMPLGERYVSSINYCNNKLVYLGTEQVGKITEQYEEQLNIILFGVQTQTSVVLHNLRIHKVSISEDNKIIREFIPCYRTYDHKPGMYDIVNDVFYTNAGTDEFLVGADVGAPKLPSEYQEVEYLESDGTQYIDTDVSAPDGFVFEADLEITKQVGAIDCIIGAHELSQPYKLNLFAISVIDNAGLIISAGDVNVYSYTSEYNKKYSIQASTQKGDVYILLDTTPILSGTNLALRSNRNLFLFADNNVMNGASQYSAIRLWNNAKIIVDNVLVRDLYPCYRKADNVAGMYDIVNGVFYTNAGTGEFIVGPDVI